MFGLKWRASAQFVAFLVGLLANTNWCYFLYSNNLDIFKKRSLKPALHTNCLSKCHVEPTNPRIVNMPRSQIKIECLFECCRSFLGQAMKERSTIVPQACTHPHLIVEKVFKPSSLLLQDNEATVLPSAESVFRKIN
uniref:Uncharacterized protein n=1 Tax=Glossina austeni TaxID=7395 RepID=A0A1A9UYR0_GLOAU